LELVVRVEEHERAAGQRHVLHEVRHLVRLRLLVPSGAEIRSRRK
jgi:hypothetical protein